MLSRLGTKGLLKGLLQKRFRALGLFLASYENRRRIKTSKQERLRNAVSLFALRGRKKTGGKGRVANWSDSKNAMHKAKKCQKVPL